jgi:RimJ/RimL family protein N-acetyltransferase
MCDPPEETRVKPRTTTAADNRPLILRQAQADDAAAVLAYVDQVCRETDFLTFGPGEFTLTLEQERDYLAHCREAETCLYLLALMEGEIVGSLTFQAGKRRRVRHAGEFGISVRQAFWGLGIASALIDALVAWARERGIVKIDLRVRADNARAIALYERKGFVVEGRLTKEICVDGVYYDHLCMGLDLEE